MFSLAPRKATLSLKFVVSTTNVFPSQRPLESPSHSRTLWCRVRFVPPRVQPLSLRLQSLPHECRTLSLHHSASPGERKYCWSNTPGGPVGRPVFSARHMASSKLWAQRCLSLQPRTSG